MKLAFKVTVAAILGSLAVLAVDAAIGAEREVEQFESDVRRDQLLLGNLLGSAVEDAYLRDGVAAAERVTMRAGRERDGITIHLLFDPAHAKIGEAAEKALDGEPETRSTERAVITYVPLELDDRTAVLELSESVGERDRYVARTLRFRALTTLVLAIVLTGLEMWTGAVLLGRPLRKLVAHARRIGKGDLDQRVDLPQNDEIGELAAEMNQMAHDLARARDELASAASARIHALEQLRHAERLTTVGKLAAGVAHELGTPLNVVAVRARLIAQGDRSAGAPEISARVIADQAERMARIIRQLLDFARPRPPEKQPQPLRPIVETTVAMLEPMARKRGVELRVVGDGAAVSAEVDAPQVQQVVTNLVVNAIQASGSGAAVEVNVGAEDDPPGHDGPFAFVRVQDRGQGIEPDVLPHLFEPFFTTKDVGEGTGLGLSVSYGIVQEHGGFVRVHSEPGKGSTFAAYLPRRSA